jgi:hypothetical protein
MIGFQILINRQQFFYPHQATSDAGMACRLAKPTAQLFNSFQIRIDHLKNHLHVFSSPFRFWFVDHMLSQVLVDDCSHQTVDCASDGGNLLQDGGAITFFSQLFFQCDSLSLNASDPGQQLGFVSDRVGHFSSCSSRDIAHGDWSSIQMSKSQGFCDLLCVWSQQATA